VWDVGHYEATYQPVTYRVGDREYEQDIPVRFRSQVEEGAGPLPLDRSERPCLGRTTPLNPIVAT
jgi:hypothetical protein